MIRIAFPMVGGAGWTGGLNYLVNLLAALREYASDTIEPVLFVETEAELAALAPVRAYVSRPPVVVSQDAGTARRWRKGFDRFIRQRDVVLERALLVAGVQLVFQHSAWFGLRFGLPTLTWIPDFQHRHLPNMFSRAAWLKRELGYRGLSYSATQLMLSSDDARHDCERFYSAARGKCHVVPFAVMGGDWASDHAIAAMRERHGLPEHFFYLPNQFWKHKNHRIVIDAVAGLRDGGIDVVVASSGNMQDARDPAFPESLLARVHEAGLEAHFRFLGMVPRADIPLLMQSAIAVINPSLFEGWSTVVEEAKALGVKLLLSDLRVHREQAPMQATFFDPENVGALAALLSAHWTSPDPLPRDYSRYEAAQVRNEHARAVFAKRFEKAAANTLLHWKKTDK